MVLGGLINVVLTASIKLGMIELGQGSTTGLLMIAAEELNMDMSQLKMVANDTDLTPNQGGTYGSQAVHVGGKQTRAAAAAAYQALLGMASTQLGVPAASLSVSKGVVSGGGKQITYGQLIGDKLFNTAIPASYKLASVPYFFGGPAFIGMTVKGQEFPSNGKIPSDYKMWQPRLGFSWNPSGDGKAVLRANATTNVLYMTDVAGASRRCCWPAATRRPPGWPAWSGTDGSSAARSAESVRSR